MYEFLRSTSKIEMRATKEGRITRMSIWRRTQEIAQLANRRRVDKLLGDHPNLSAAGDALDFIAQILVNAPNKTSEQGLRLHLCAWTSERLRAAMLVLLVNGAPNAAILTERALTGLELQLLFKIKPDVERTYMAGARVDRDDLQELRRHYWWLKDLGWLRGAVWPHPPLRGKATTSDIALAKEGDDPATEFKVVHAVAKIASEQLLLMSQTFARLFESPATKTRLNEVRRAIKFGPLSDLLFDLETDPVANQETRRAGVSD